MEDEEDKTNSADAVGVVPDEEGNDIYMYNILYDVIMIIIM